MLQCLQPLQSLHKAWVLASRLGLPPPQDVLGTADEITDCKMAVLGCNMEADKLCYQVGGQEQLQAGFSILMIMVAMPSKEENLGFSVLPGP